MGHPALPADCVNGIGTQGVDSLADSAGFAPFPRNASGFVSERHSRDGPRNEPAAYGPFVPLLLILFALFRFNFNFRFRRQRRQTQVEFVGGGHPLVFAGHINTATAAWAKVPRNQLAAASEPAE